MKALKSFEARGRVQGVMFRQTLIRGALKRGLRAGATNDPADRGRVTFTVEGAPAALDAFIGALLATKPLSSMGAEAEAVAEITPPIPMERHEVTTDNVGQFHWRGGVEMYL